MLVEWGRGSRFITGGDDRKAQARIEHAGCEPLVTSAPSYSFPPPFSLFHRSRAARQQSTHSTAFNERCVSGQLGVVAYTLTWLLFFAGLPQPPLPLPLTPAPLAIYISFLVFVP